MAADKPTAVSEYQVKAAFLFNFVQFVEWPASAHATADSPIVIGILGEDPFGTALDKALNSGRVSGRPLELRRFKEGDEVTGCHLLFISSAVSSVKDRVGDLLQKLADRPVLTVSETAGFAERGGIINFVMAEKKVRFEANPHAAARQGLKISSRLLQLARVVEGGSTEKQP